MANTSGDILAIHQDLQKIHTTMQASSVTLNTTIRNLINQVTALVEAGWDGLGATAYSGYMTRYEADQAKMNQALSQMSEQVQLADADYTTADTGVQTAFQAGQ